MIFPLLSRYVTETVVEPPTEIVIDVGVMDIAEAAFPLDGLPFPNTGSVGEPMLASRVALQAVRANSKAEARPRDARERMVLSGIFGNPTGMAPRPSGGAVASLALRPRLSSS